MVRSELAQFELAEIWNVPAGCMLKPLERGGYNNFLYRLHGDAGPLPYVLRVYGNHNNPRFIQHEMAVLTQLAQHALPFAIPVPIPTRRGELWALVDDGRAVRLMVLLPFIPGANPDVRHVGQAESAAEALAILHQALARVVAGGSGAPRPYVELNKVHPLVPDPFEAMRMLGSLVPGSVRRRIEAILEQLQEDIKRKIKPLPQQLTHGDFISGNVLMEDVRVTGVLDFENCALNPPAMDFAIMIDAWCWDVLGTGDEWLRLDALGRGYSRVRKFAEAEVAALPALVLLRSAHVLMHLIGRFLANLSPFVDVEGWLDAMLRVDAWLMLNGNRLMERARGW